MSEFKKKYQTEYNNNDLGELHGVIYILGNRLFYIPLSEVEDIFQPKISKSVPGGVDYFKGITVNNERAICLISTHNIVEFPEPGELEAIQLVSNDNTKLAFTIDRFYSVINKAQLEIFPGEIESPNEQMTESIKAQYQYEGKKVLELDFLRLL